MSYQIKTVKAGKITVVKKYHCYRQREPKAVRRKRENITPEAKQKLNRADAVDRLYYRLCANFTSDDLYITLKYDGEVNRSIACEQMREDVQKFIRLMRAAYKKQGKELVYALSYGISANKVRHAHMVVPGVSQKIIQDCWKKASSHAGRITFEYLWSNYDYRGLAEYFVKNGVEAHEYAPDVFKHFFICSRNMQKPVITIKTIEKSGTFKEGVKAPDGYEIIDSRTGCDFFGYKYLKYTMRKIE